MNRLAACLRLGCFPFMVPLELLRVGAKLSRANRPSHGPSCLSKQVPSIRRGRRYIPGIYMHVCIVLYHSTAVIARAPKLACCCSRELCMSPRAQVTTDGTPRSFECYYNRVPIANNTISTSTFCCRKLLLLVLLIHRFAAYIPGADLLLLLVV